MTPEREHFKAVHRRHRVISYSVYAEVSMVPFVANLICSGVFILTFILVGFEGISHATLKTVN